MVKGLYRYLIKEEIEDNKRILRIYIDNLPIFVSVLCFPLILMAFLIIENLFVNINLTDSAKPLFIIFTFEFIFIFPLFLADRVQKKRRNLTIQCSNNIINVIEKNPQFKDGMLEHKITKTKDTRLIVGRVKSNAIFGGIHNK
jgi:hypothetical protein